MADLMDFLNDNTFSRNPVYINKTGQLESNGKEYVENSFADPFYTYKDLGMCDKEENINLFKCDLFKASNNSVLFGEPLKVFNLKVVQKPKVQEKKYVKTSFLGTFAIKEDQRKYYSDDKNTFTVTTAYMSESNCQARTIQMFRMMKGYDTTREPLLKQSIISENFDENYNVKDNQNDGSDQKLNKEDELMESLNDSDVEMLLQTKKTHTQGGIEVPSTDEIKEGEQETKENKKETEKFVMSIDIDVTIVVTKKYIVFGDRKYIYFESDIVDCEKISNFNLDEKTSDFLLVTLEDNTVEVLKVISEGMIAMDIQDGFKKLDQDKPENNNISFVSIKPVQTLHLGENKSRFKDQTYNNFNKRKWEILIHPSDPKVCIFYCMKTSQLKIYEIDLKNYRLKGTGNLWLKNHKFQMVGFFEAAYSKNENITKDKYFLSDNNNNKDCENKNSNKLFMFYVISEFEKKDFSLIFEYYYNWVDEQDQQIKFHSMELHLKEKLYRPLKGTRAIAISKNQLVTANQSSTKLCCYNLGELMSAETSKIGCLNKNASLTEKELLSDQDKIKIRFIKNCDSDILNFWKEKYPSILNKYTACFIVCCSPGLIFLAFSENEKPLKYGLLTKIKGANDVILKALENQSGENEENESSLQIVISNTYGFVHQGLISEFIKTFDNKFEPESLILEDMVVDTSIKNFSNIQSIKEIYTSVPHCNKLLTIPTLSGSGSNGMGSLEGKELWSVDNQYGITQFFYNRPCVEFDPVFEDQQFMSFNKFLLLDLNSFDKEVVKTHFFEFIEDGRDTNEFKFVSFSDSIARTKFYLLDTKFWKFQPLPKLNEKLDSSVPTSEMKLLDGKFLVRLVGSFKNILRIEKFSAVDKEIENFDIIFKDVEGKTISNFELEPECVEVAGLYIACLIPYGTANGLFVCNDIRKCDIESKQILFEQIESPYWAKEKEINFIASNLSSHRQMKVYFQDIFYYYDTIDGNFYSEHYGPDMDLDDENKGEKMFKLHMKPSAASFKKENNYTFNELTNDYMCTDHSGVITYNPYRIHYMPRYEGEVFDVKLNLKWNPKNHMILCCELIDFDHMAVLFDDNFYVFKTDSSCVKTMQRILLKKFLDRSFTFDIFEYCDKVNRVLFFDRNMKVCGIKLHHNMNKMCQIDDNKIYSKKKSPPLIFKKYPSLSSENFNILVSYDKDDKGFGSKYERSGRNLKLIKLLPGVNKIKMKLLYELKLHKNFKLDGSVQQNDAFGDSIRFIEFPQNRTLLNNDYYLMWLYSEKTNMIKVLRFKTLNKNDNVELICNYNWKLPYGKKLKQMSSLPGDRLLILYDDNCLNVLENRVKIKQDVEDSENNIFRKYMISAQNADLKGQNSNITNSSLLNKDLELEHLKDINYNYEFNHFEFDGLNVMSNDIINNTLHRQKGINNTNNISNISEEYIISEVYMEDIPKNELGSIEYILPFGNGFYHKNNNLIMTIQVVPLPFDEEKLYMKDGYKKGYEDEQTITVSCREFNLFIRLLSFSTLPNIQKEPKNGVSTRFSSRKNQENESSKSNRRFYFKERQRFPLIDCNFSTSSFSHDKKDKKHDINNSKTESHYIKDVQMVQNEGNKTALLHILLGNNQLETVQLSQYMF